MFKIKITTLFVCFLYFSPPRFRVCGSVWTQRLAVCVSLSLKTHSTNQPTARPRAPFLPDLTSLLFARVGVKGFIYTRKSKMLCLLPCFFFSPAIMSCRIWLNVWSCRSFTSPFTRRKRERNPTAAVISGFMVPRAQRGCIGDSGAKQRRALHLHVLTPTPLSSPFRVEGSFHSYGLR